MNGGMPEKQGVMAHEIVRVALGFPSLEEALPTLLQNYEKGCGM